MSVSTSHVSTYGRYIGRVGALAAALGIGIAVVTSPGLAAADTTAPSSSSSSGGSTDTATGAASSDSTSTPTDSAVSAPPSSTSTTTDSTTTDERTAATTDIPASLAGATSSSTEVAPGVTVSSSGGAQTAATQTDPSTVVPATPGDSTAEGVPTPPETTPPVDTAEPVPPSATPAETPQVTATVADIDSNSAHSASLTDTASPPASSITATSVVETHVASHDTQPAAATADPTVTPTARKLFSTTATEAPTALAAATPVTPTAAANPVIGVVGFLNQVVTNLLNPFLAPAPNTPEPFTPVAWAVLGWVRRNLFNEAPTINVAPTTSTLGPTVTGTLATDPEGDPLTYTVIGATQVGSDWHTDTGIVTINQATNTFTFTPNDVNLTSEQQHSFTVSVTDGKTNLLSLFGVPHTDRETVNVVVRPPTAELVSESRAGLVSGTATVVETQQAWCPSGSRCFSPGDEVLTIRTVTYDNFADQPGLVLNGTESTATNANRTFRHYLADVEVTNKHGQDRGFLQANARLISRQTGQTLTGYIVSSIDGNLRGLPGDPVSANVAVNFGDEQGALLHTERYNQFHVSTTFAGQRPQDVEFLNEIGLHATMYRAWLNSPNQTEPTCTGSASACELTPSMRAYLKDLGDVSDAQIANLRLVEWVGLDPHEAQAEMEGILLAVKREQPEIVYIEAWNEPDQPPGGVDGGVTPAQAYAGYQALYRAVNTVNATLAEGNPDYVPLKVGGPALFYFNKTYLEAFLDHYVADTDPNKRLDFISYHGYLNVLPNGSRQFFKENPSWVMNYRNETDAILAARGLPINTPVFVTETGIYPGPLCDNCDSTDYAHQAAGMAALHYWFSQQHDTYLFNWVARRQGLKDQFVTQNAVGPQLNLTDPRNPTILWEPLDPLPTDALTPYGNMMLMQSMMEDVKVSAVSNQLNNGLGVYTLAAKDPVLPEASVMVWNYPGCSGTPGTTSCGATAYDTTIGMSALPNGLGDGPVTLTVYRIDQHTSNYWENPLNTDLSKAQLEQVDQRTVQPVDGSVSYQADLLPNSVYLVLLRKNDGTEGTQTA